MTTDDDLFLPPLPSSAARTEPRAEGASRTSAGEGAHSDWTLDARLDRIEELLREVLRRLEAIPRPAGEGAGARPGQPAELADAVSGLKGDLRAAVRSSGLESNRDYADAVRELDEEHRWIHEHAAEMGRATPAEEGAILRVLNLLDGWHDAVAVEIRSVRDRYQGRLEGMLAGRFHVTPYHRIVSGRTRDLDVPKSHMEVIGSEPSPSVQGTVTRITRRCFVRSPSDEVVQRSLVYTSDGSASDA